VKCVTILPLGGVELLVTGSSDSTIILWNTTTGAKLQVVRGHSMGVLALAVDPISLSDYSNNQVENHDNPILFSASSDSAIFRWRICKPDLGEASRDIGSTILSQVEPALRPHETSIYALLFPQSSTDLYTASADGTVQRLSREHSWISDTTFQHGDYVRAVAVSRGERFVVTGGRSEDVKVWDGNTGKELMRWEGHYDEITGLIIVERRGEESVVSVGIDGTVRVWPLSLEAFETAKREREDEENGVEKDEVVEVEGGLTAEEEAELADLMDE
jgi:WD40 repeat protein